MERQRFFFWADSRPNGGGFHSHLGVPVSLNTYYDDKIRYAGSGTWNINVGGWTGTSTSNIDGAGMIETGTEVTTQSATVCSSQSNLQWWDQGGGLHSGWSDSTGNAGRTTSNPPYATWVSPQSWLRDYANISGIQDNVPDLASLGPVTVDLPAAASAASTPRVATKTRTGVLVGAIRFAGGPSPVHPRPPAAGVVTVFTPAGRALARQSVAKGHRFRFVLAPGRYQLNAGRTLRPTGGCAPKRAVVRAGRRTTVDVETGCNIP